MVRVKHQENYTNNNNNNISINNNDIKSHLAIDTYNIYKNSLKSSCKHFNNNNNNSFIDWYLILRVGEDSSIVIIRKQYHKLALLLHPDKNKHPKAEFSFKLISQAFECLSDNAKRSSFNLERRRKQCAKCNQKPSPYRAAHVDKRETVPASSQRSSRSREVEHDFRALREKLQEEARVIESCMKLNRASKDEYPVFDPSSYTHLGYPHKRTQQFSNNKAANSWNLQKENVDLNYDRWRSRCEIPVFELKTDYRKLNTNSAC